MIKQSKKVLKEQSSEESSSDSSEESDSDSSEESDKKIEHQALLNLCEGDKLINIILHEHCNETNMNKASEIFHASIRKKLKTSLIFYIKLIDETELKSKHYKCSVEGKIKRTQRVSEKQVAKDLRTLEESSVLKYYSKNINNLVAKNKSELVKWMQEIIKNKRAEKEEAYLKHNII